MLTAKQNGFPLPPAGEGSETGDLSQVEAGRTLLPFQTFCGAYLYQHHAVARDRRAKCSLETANVLLAPKVPYRLLYFSAASAALY